jgi:hypothetical protein
MELSPDFSELVELFNARKVDYVIVGAFALAFHGAPRFTGDLDILVRPEQDNSRRVLDALQAFGFGSLNLQAEDFSDPHRVIQLGFPPVRIDLMTSLTGLTWEEIATGKIAGLLGKIPVQYLGKAELIRNKRAVGRAKDLADIESLQ